MTDLSVTVIESDKEGSPAILQISTVDQLVGRDLLQAIATGRVEFVTLTEHPMSSPFPDVLTIRIKKD